MALAHHPRIVTDGLVLCLDAANTKSYTGSGTTWSDLSGNENNGTLINGVGYSTDNNGVMVFDGVPGDSAVSIPTAFLPNQLFADSGGSWSVSCWFRFPISPSGSRTGNASWALVGRAGGIATGGTWMIYVGSETDTTYGAYAPFKVASTVRGAVTVMSDSVNTNTWNNVVITWNGSSGNYYFNTQSGALNVGTATLQNYTEFYIGSTSNLGSHYYEGDIPAVYIYNRAISASEVKQNYSALRGRFSF